MPSSPTTGSETTLAVTEWDEELVNGFVVNVLKLEQYQDLIYEHGITGDVLIALDHDALSDMGIASLGHRLKLLRAVWEVKRDQGIEFGEDDWKPQDALDGTPTEIDRLKDHIGELQERLMNLERDHVRMLMALEEKGITVPVASSADGDIMRGLPPARGSSTKWKEFEGNHSEAGSSKITRRHSQLYPSNRQQSPHPPQPHSSDSATFRDASFTPTPNSHSNHTYTSDSTGHLKSLSIGKPLPPLSNSQSSSSQATNKPIRGVIPPPFTRMISASSLANSGSGSQPSPPLNSNGSISMSNQTPANNRVLQPSALGNTPSTSLASSTTSVTSAATSNTLTPNNASGGGGEKERSAKESASRAAKSFRVTLEDPCWKVLPAALKKYKINDDWKQYALFICYGTTERCLSYDEKPLLLFQKLKEAGQKPVFMLRHMRDIRSPIAVAQQKQALKIGLAADTTVDVLPKVKPTTDNSISPVKGHQSSGSTSNLLLPTRHRGGDEDLPSPGLRDADGSTGRDGVGGIPNSAVTPNTGFGGNHGGNLGGNMSLNSNGQLVDSEGVIQEISYAVAIYPYIADRQDEFDVAVGATFVILNKAKGWYIVQKDHDGLGQIVPDNTQSGWVPAGCLLEMSQPISLISPDIKEGEPLPPYPGLAALPPTAIVSSSYPGIVLMDYASKADDELQVKEGEKVRVYKKYCHWSYAIKQDTGERGWVPAWFIGKVSTTSPTPASSSSMTGSQPSTSADGDITPTTATLTAAPRSGESVISNIPSSANEKHYKPERSGVGGAEDGDGNDADLEENEEIGFGEDDGGAGVAALKGYL